MLWICFLLLTWFVTPMRIFVGLFMHANALETQSFGIVILAMSKQSTATYLLSTHMELGRNDNGLGRLQRIHSFIRMWQNVEIGILWLMRWKIVVCGAIWAVLWRSRFLHMTKILLPGWDSVGGREWRSDFRRACFVIGTRCCGSTYSPSRSPSEDVSCLPFVCGEHYWSTWIEFD